MRRVVLVTLGIAVLVSLPTAFAATLGTDSDNVGGDDVVIASCDTTATVTYNQAVTGGPVTGLTVTGFDPAACVNHRVFAAVTDAAGNFDAWTTTPGIVSTTGTVSVTFNTAQQPQDVRRYTIVAIGP